MVTFGGGALPLISSLHVQQHRNKSGAIDLLPWIIRHATFIIVINCCNNWHPLDNYRLSDELFDDNLYHIYIK